MIRRVWSWACMVVSVGAMVLAGAAGCREASSPGADPIDALAREAEVATAALELAEQACPLLPPDDAKTCADTAEGPLDLVQVADAVVEARSECALGDRDCAAAVGELARERMPELRRLLLRLLVLTGRAP